MTKSITPQPVVVTTICSECDLPWENHGEKPTTADCIRLLKAELLKPRGNTFVWNGYPYQTYPYTINCQNTTLANAKINYSTPTIQNTACVAVTA